MLWPHWRIPLFCTCSAQSQISTCIFNSYMYHRAHIRAFLSLMKKVLRYKLLREHGRQKVFELAGSGFCLCPGTNAGKWKRLVMNKSWHISHQWAVSTKLQSCHGEKKRYPNTTTSVASILVRLCISNACVAGMSQKHHLVLLRWGYAQATTHKVLIVPCRWDQPKWEIHLMSMNRTWPVLLVKYTKTYIYRVSQRNWHHFKGNYLVSY